MCGIYQGRIRHVVENLRRVISTYGFDKIALELTNFEPAFRHYPEFERVLDGFVKVFGDCPGCVAGGGDPTCGVRECCKEHARITCGECFEMDVCEKIRAMPLSQHRFRALKAALRVKLPADETSPEL